MREGDAMFRILFCCVALTLVSMTELVRGQDLMQQTTPQVVESYVKVPGTNFEVKLGGAHFREPNGVISQDLVAAIETWLSVQFSLPPVQQHPTIILVPAKEIVALRYNSVLVPGRSVEDQNDTLAVYHDPSQTIYLAQDWNGSTPAEQSILVHEMVHHFQNILGIKYECGQEREQLAYRAQDRWLGLFGHDLATDFDLDAFSLLVKTKCFY
jgi:predicted metalloprotease